MDLIHRLAKWFEHNRGLAIALGLVASLAWTIGCQSTTAALGDDMTRPQVEVEATVFMAKYEAAIAELNNKDKLKTDALLFFRDIAQKYIPPPFASWAMPLASIGFAVIGGGAVWDNRRKDKVIAAKK